MESLRLKYQYLQQYWESKFIALSKHLTRNFFPYLALIMMPPLILGVVLCHQTKQVVEATNQPLLTNKAVKKLESQVSISKQQVAHYKKKADSLQYLGTHTALTALRYEHSADSLKYLHDQVSASTATAAELASYLTNYRPTAYHDSL